MLCAGFGAYVARRRGRSPVLWGLAAGLVPVAGVVICWRLKPPSPKHSTDDEKAILAFPRQRPKRCCGSYIPDCHGCSYFRRSLFDTAHDDAFKGYCSFFEKELEASEHAQIIRSE